MPSITVLELITPRLIAFSSTVVVAHARIADHEDIFAFDKRIIRRNRQHGQIALHGEERDVAFAIFVEKLCLRRALVASRGGRESDFQVGDKLFLDHVSVGGDHAMADEETSAA